MKKLLSKLALIILALYGLPARADILLPGDFDSTSFAFGDSFAAGVAGALWSNTVTFNLAAANTVSWFFATQDLGSHDLDIQGVTLNGNPFGVTDSFSATSGLYALTVSGVVNGTGDSSYVGLLQAQTPDGPIEPPSPIPEPGTYALMFAGLAAMGFVVRRRRQV